MVRVYEPKIKVKLIKTIARTMAAEGWAVSGRSRGNGTVVNLDLENYLGEQGGVRTSKSVRDPCGGFTVTLADRMHPVLMDTLAASIEPMDLIEIRMSHIGYSHQLPIIMRGFVSSVRREESMGQDGRPSRRVVISGQDYGKLWQIYQIYYLQNAAIGELYLSSLKFFEKYSSDDYAVMQPVSEFFSKVINEVLNPYLSTLAWAKNYDPSTVNVITPVVKSKGTVSPFTLQGIHDVSLYQMLVSLLDVGPFNELYIEDTEKGVNAVLRPTPFEKISNGSLQYIQDGADSQTVQISRNDLMSLVSERTDAGVGNWFWVACARGGFIRDEKLKLEAQTGNQDNLQRFQYMNSAIDRYGFRKMETTVSMGPDGLLSAAGDNQYPDEQQGGRFEMEWLDERRRILAESNQDNVVLESGTMRLRGNPDLKAGRYIQLQRHASKETSFSCYAVRVDHEFMPFGAYTTTVQFERGTGFAQRLNKSMSPYLAEIDSRGIR